ncbi:MAG TPA: glutaminyl-peptide cyclotransferase [Gammaproteobacteria bacterium]|nr:glutaminyl-peptide cyclotransferase [Gammaproteobacteria bacterium]
MLTRRGWLQSLVVAGVLAGAGALTVCAQQRAPTGPIEWTARVVAAYPHDPGAFTQGLAVHDGQLYESTGQYGHSSIRRVDLQTGRVEQIAPLNFSYFGEGLAILGERIYQLTWKSQLAFVYDRSTFELVDTKRYRGEGWGLTHDGESLIVSNGSAVLTFYDPESFAAARSIEVRGPDGPVPLLNELEYIDGEIWANIWYDDRVVRIDPASGAVLGWIDLSHLVPRAQRDADSVLNGIAYDADAGRLFVTGKYWPELFEIELARL